MLYKMDTNGKIRIWNISVGVESGGRNFYEIINGTDGGAITTFRTYVDRGKNIGRANETTAAEQCKAEADALRKRQIERKGYSQSTPSAAPLRPMLAKHYQEEREKIQFPCMVQPKLDGYRVLAFIKQDGVKLFSRYNTEFFGLNHICKELAGIYKKYGEVILDGELFSRKFHIQSIGSLVKKTVNLSEDSSNIEMWVYDIINKKPYHERYLDFSYMISGMTHVIPTPTHIISSEKDIEYYHKKFVEDNFEGTMIRNIGGLYKINSRSSDLLKYKDFIDEEFEIVSYKTGKGKYSNVPTFILKTSDGNRFDAVPIGSQEERENYLKNATSYIGKMAKVKFFEYTDSKNTVPRFPVIIEMDRQA